MAEEKKYFSLPNINIDFLTISLLIVAIAVNWWLTQKQISAGDTYWGLLIGGIIVIVITLIITLLSGEEKTRRIKQIFRIPFGTPLKVSVFAFLTGIFICLLLTIVISGFSSYSITSFSVPLFGNSISQGFSQTFSQVELQENMIWKIIVYSFDAGTIEEIIYDWIVPLASLILVWFILKLILEEKPLFSIEGNQLVKILVLIVAVLAFSLTHVLNSNYDSFKMYFVAGLFKFVTLALIFYLGVPISFAIGYHMMNNFLWLVQTEGGVAVFKGLVSLGGITIILVLVLMMYYVVRNWSEIINEVKGYVKSS